MVAAYRLAVMQRKVAAAQVGSTSACQWYCMSCLPLPQD